MKLFGFNITRRKAKPKAVFRDFGAASVSDLLADWKLDGGWVPGTMGTQLPIMRGRSRQEVKNNGWAIRLVELFATNVVGDTGFSLRPMPPYSPGKIDTVAADILKNAWNGWADSPEYCDRAGIFDFQAICAFAATSWFRDGEAFIQIIRGGFPENPYAFSLSVLNPAMCDANLNVDQRRTWPGMTGHAIINGVEVDAHDKPLAYWFKSADNASRIWTADYNSAQNYARIPAADIIHCYDKTIAGQTRGVPRMYASLVKLHMLGEYENAELVAARKDANTVSTYEVQPGAVSSPDDVADEQTAIDAIRESQPGLDEFVAFGYTKKTNAPTRPNQALEAFRKGMLRGVSAGTGTAYNTLANDGEGVSYSSIRDLKLTERDIYKMAQAVVARTVCRRTYREWLRVYLLSPMSSLPAAKYDKFAVHAWRGRRWPWVDPNSESRYNEMARKYGWKTDADIADEIGQDYDENLAQIKADTPKVTGTYLEGQYANAEPKPTA